MTFYRVIDRHLRDKLDLARKTDINKATIYDFFNKKKDLNLYHLFQISEKLNISIYNLLSDEDLVPVSKCNDMVEKAAEIDNKYSLVPEYRFEDCCDISGLSSNNAIGYKVFGKDFLKDFYKPFVTKVPKHITYAHRMITFGEDDLILVNANPEIREFPILDEIFLINKSPYKKKCQSRHCLC